MTAANMPAVPTPYLPARPPTDVQRRIKVTEVPTGLILTLAVAKSWHFQNEAEMTAFRRELGV
jgi:hypothetical protein